MVATNLSAFDDFSLQDPAARINAAMAIACLVGHEEGNPRLQMDDELIAEMLDVLNASCKVLRVYRGQLHAGALAGGPEA